MEKQQEDKPEMSLAEEGLQSDEPLATDSKTKSTILLAGVRFVSMLITLISVRFYLNWMPEASYGAAVFSTLLARYVSLIDIGFSDGGQLMLMRASAPGSKDSFWHIRRTHMSLACLHGIGGILIFLMVAIFPPELKEFGGSYLALFASAGFLHLAQTLLVANNIALNAQRDFRTLANTNLVTAVLGTLLGLILVYLTRRPLPEPGRPEMIILGQAIAALIAYGIGVQKIRRFAVVPAGAPWLDIDLARRFLRSGYKNLGNRLAASLASTADRILLGYRISATSITWYETSSKIPLACSELSNPMIQTLGPELAHSYLKGPKAFSMVLNRNALIMLAVGTIVVMIPSAFGRPLLSLWLGDKMFMGTPGLVWLGGGAFVMFGMGVYRTFELYYSCFGTAMFLAGKPKYTFPFTLWNGLATLGLTLPFYSWLGVEGLAVMNISIHCLQLVPLIRLVTKKIAPEMHFVSHICKVLGIVSIGLVLSTGSFFLCRTEILVEKPLLALSIIPMVSLLGGALIFGMRLADVPLPIKRAIRRLIPKTHKQRNRV